MKAGDIGQDSCVGGDIMISFFRGLSLQFFFQGRIFPADGFIVCGSHPGAPAQFNGAVVALPVNVVIRMPASQFFQQGGLSCALDAFDK